MTKEQFIRFLCKRILKYVEKLEDDIYYTNESLMICFNEQEYKMLKQIVEKPELKEVSEEQDASEGRR